MKLSTTYQAAIKRAMECDDHVFQLEQSSLIALQLSNRQVDKILHISWRDRCALQEQGMIPICWGRRVFYYSPIDVPDLFTSNKDDY